LHHRHLYAVLTHQINDNLLQDSAKTIVELNTDRKQLLSPIADVSTLGWSVIVCFLRSIWQNEQLSEELIYSLSKSFVFTPLINSLTLLCGVKSSLSLSADTLQDTIEQLLEFFGYVLQKRFICRISSCFWKVRLR
jgi:hypothetical protein